MKKNYFISFFICTHVVLIFLQVHKHTLFVKNSYHQQQYEKKIALLAEKKQVLTQEIHAMKDRESIKQYACNKLKMRPYTLQQIQKLPHDDTKL